MRPGPGAAGPARAAADRRRSGSPTPSAAASAGRRPTTSGRCCSSLLEAQTRRIAEGRANPWELAAGDRANPPDLPAGVSPAAAGRLDGRLPGAAESGRDDHQGIEPCNASSRPASTCWTETPHRHARLAAGSSSSAASAWARWRSAQLLRRDAPPASPRRPTRSRPRRRTSPPRPSASSTCSWPAAPSHLELFDYKPQLAQVRRQAAAGRAAQGLSRRVHQPELEAARARSSSSPGTAQCGAELSELLPHLAGVVDDIAIVKSMVTDAFNHAPGADLDEHRLAAVRPAEHGRLGRPTGWAASRRTCPASSSSAPATRGPAAATPTGAAASCRRSTRACSSATSGDPVLYLSNPPRRRRATCSATRSTPISALNRMRLDVVGDPEIATRINSFEMAFRMQIERPGADGPRPRAPSTSSSCTAPSRASRRSPTTACWPGGWSSAASGSSSSSTRRGTSTATWSSDLKTNCQDTDQACAALIKDLKQRGLLDDTLVIWGGEFGRTPMVRGRRTTAATITPTPSRCGWPAAASSRA